MKKEIMQKNIVVAGGAGFIGSHLCDYLVKKNKVICIDNFIGSAYNNISHLLTNPNFEFIKHDLAQPIDLESFSELERFEIVAQGIQDVYNLACPTSPKNFDQFKIQTLDANSTVIKNTLDIAVKYNAKYLLTSSSVVYGSRNDDNPYCSEDKFGLIDFLGPRACYDEGKRFAETFVSTYRQVYDLDAKIARVFRTYGPRLKLFQGEMISDFILDALEDQNLIIYGDEKFTTSLLYIDDLINGLILLMESSHSGPINFGSISDENISAVAQKIIEMIGSKSKIIYEPPLLFTSQLPLPDIRLAKELLDWVPVTQLSAGLQQTIDYTKAYRVILKSKYM